MFDLHCVQVQKLRIGHDNAGQGPGWYVDDVMVDVPARSEHYMFPCRRWLAENEDDKKIERDLYPGEQAVVWKLKHKDS